MNRALREGARQEPRPNEDRLQTVIDSIPALVASHLPDGSFDLVNRRWLEYAGLGLHDFQLSGWRVVAHPDDLVEWARPWQEALATGDDFAAEARLRRADGAYRRFLGCAAARRDARGNILSWSSACIDIEDRKRPGDNACEGAHFLQTYSRRLLEVQEAERHHLARELHDEIGQILTGLRLRLKTNRELTAEAAITVIEEARRSVDELLERVRGLSFDLRPAVLDQLGLLPALLALFERFTQHTGILVNFKHQGMERRFAPALETACYRIVQEGLTNIARHAGVAGAMVRVWAVADTLSLQVEDRGRGFDPEAALATMGSTGLAGMRERAMLLKGNLTIESQPGAGTMITAEFPVDDLWGGRQP